SERGSRLSDEDRDGVLKLVTRRSNVNFLGARLLALCCGQGDIFTRSEAASKTVLRELKRFRKSVDIGIKQLLLRIQSAQGHVLQGQLRVQAEANRFQIRCRGLRQRAAGLHAPPDASPNVSLVREISLEDQIRIIDRSCSAEQGFISGLAILRWCYAGRDEWKQGRSRFSQHVSRFLKPVHG